MLFNKKNNTNELKNEIKDLRSDMNKLSENILTYGVLLDNFMKEIRNELPQLADTIIHELNNSLEDLIYIPKSEDRCEAVDEVNNDEYILQVYQHINKNKTNNRIYKPSNLYFDGYNFINRIGPNKNKISFTIDDVKFFNKNLGSVCETLVENNYRFSIVYNETSISKNVFPKFLFNIIEGTFNNLEPFTEKPNKKNK